MFCGLAQLVEDRVAGGRRRAPAAAISRRRPRPAVRVPLRGSGRRMGRIGVIRLLTCEAYIADGS